MKEQFSNRLGLNKANKERLEVVNGIVEEYSEQGYRLTLRQLYYQLVSRNIIENNVKQYGKLSSLLVKGRMGGIVDWDAIEDRIRVPYVPYWVKDIKHAVQDTIDQYRIDRMENQEVYIEVWVEKDALSGVLRRITSYYHINLMVNRGYSSCTAMHDASERIKKNDNKSCYILYLGDHDPSGVDMVRDIKNRLIEFEANAEVQRIALTQEQIKKYNPPPCPAKITDPRAKEYIAKFGNISWEVDALNPEILHKVIKKSVEELIDTDLFALSLEKEEADKEKLTSFIKKLK
jgi:hypothetical protein